jgi:protein subunit release factor A
LKEERVMERNPLELEEEEEEEENVLGEDEEIMMGVESTERREVPERVRSWNFEESRVTEEE